MNKSYCEHFTRKFQENIRNSSGCDIFNTICLEPFVFDFQSISFTFRCALRDDKFKKLESFIKSLPGNPTIEEIERNSFEYIPDYSTATEIKYRVYKITFEIPLDKNLKSNKLKFISSKGI